MTGDHCPSSCRLLGALECRLLHRLGECKGRGGEGKALCKSGKLPHYLAMSETFKWGVVGGSKHFLETVCCETRIEHTGSTPSPAFSGKEIRGAYALSTWKLNAWSRELSCSRRRIGRFRRFSSILRLCCQRS